MEQVSGLVENYEKVYSHIRELVNDDEIYPKIEPKDFEEFVSKRKWIGIPSFHGSMKDLKQSDKGHITIRIEANKIKADLFFHKTSSVTRFANLLHPSSQVEFKNFVDLVKSLDGRYVIELQYDEKIMDSKPNWKSVKKINCENLDETKIKQIFSSVNDLIETRATNQKKLPKDLKATISVAVGRVELDNPTDDRQLKEAFTNLASLTRITHNLKSNKELQKQIRDKKKKEEKELPLLYAERDNLKKEIMGDESFGISSGRITREAVEKKKERFKLVEDRIKEIEDGKVSKFDRK